MTKTVNLKCSTIGGRLTLAHPLARPGVQTTGAHVYRIEGVPAGLTALDVLRAAEYTIFTDPVRRKYTYTFDELGIGRVVR